MKTVLTPDDELRYEEHANGLIANPPPALRMLKFLTGDSLQTIKEVMKAGCWLGDQLRASGASDTEASDLCLCFAHGQLCFGRDPWEAASQALEGYKAGRPEQPGAELAAKIMRRAGL